eukprot:TRINITY_DN4912_c0_g2_i1.p1 TRINITY_DN4912_c0_g2~~TRINITY_DN4912_c0_g2_i1.p1  ORF type:complete len:115 (-),score=3.86 TRINITY_DN4912_c0_g2_i1:14-358(-)
MLSSSNSGALCEGRLCRSNDAYPQLGRQHPALRADMSHTSQMHRSPPGSSSKQLAFTTRVKPIQCFTIPVQYTLPATIVVQEHIEREEWRGSIPWHQPSCPRGLKSLPSHAGAG